MTIHHSLPLADRNVRVRKVFNGHLRITNENFLDAYENSTSTEFISLANQVKEAVSLVPGEVLCPACPSTLPCIKTQLISAPRSPGWGWDGGWEQSRKGVIFPIWPALSLVFSPQLKLLYSEVPVLGPYYKKSAVTAFRWVLEVAVVAWALAVWEEGHCVCPLCK